VDTADWMQENDVLVIKMILKVDIEMDDADSKSIEK